MEEKEFLNSSEKRSNRSDNAMNSRFTSQKDRYSFCLRIFSDYYVSRISTKNSDSSLRHYRSLKVLSNIVIAPSCSIIFPFLFSLGLDRPISECSQKKAMYYGHFVCLVIAFVESYFGYLLQFSYEDKPLSCTSMVRVCYRSSIVEELFFQLFLRVLSYFYIFSTPDQCLKFDGYELIMDVPIFLLFIKRLHSYIRRLNLVSINLNASDNKNRYSPHNFLSSSQLYPKLFKGFLYLLLYASFIPFFLTTSSNEETKKIWLWRFYFIFHLVSWLFGYNYNWIRGDLNNNRFLMFQEFIEGLSLVVIPFDLFLLSSQENSIELDFIFWSHVGYALFCLIFHPYFAYRIFNFNYNFNSDGIKSISGSDSSSSYSFSSDGIKSSSDGIKSSSDGIKSSSDGIKSSSVSDSSFSAHPHSPGSHAATTQLLAPASSEQQSIYASLCQSRFLMSLCVCCRALSPVIWVALINLTTVSENIPPSPPPPFPSSNGTIDVNWSRYGSIVELGLASNDIRMCSFFLGLAYNHNDSLWSEKDVILPAELSFDMLKLFNLEVGPALFDFNLTNATAFDKSNASIVPLVFNPSTYNLTADIFSISSYLSHQRNNRLVNVNFTGDGLSSISYTINVTVGGVNVPTSLCFINQPCLVSYNYKGEGGRESLSWSIQSTNETGLVMGNKSGFFPLFFKPSWYELFASLDNSGLVWIWLLHNSSTIDLLHPSVQIFADVDGSIVDVWSVAIDKNNSFAFNQSLFTPLGKHILTLHSNVMNNSISDNISISFDNKPEPQPHTYQLTVKQDGSKCALCINGETLVPYGFNATCDTGNQYVQCPSDPVFCNDLPCYLTLINNVGIRSNLAINLEPNNNDDDLIQLEYPSEIQVDCSVSSPINEEVTVDQVRENPCEVISCYAFSLYGSFSHYLSNTLVAINNQARSWW